MSKQVWWAVPRERTTLDLGAAALERVGMDCGMRDYRRLDMPYMRTDAARNLYALKFLQESKSADDVLVMLDNDHIHPSDVVYRLAQSLTDEAGGIGVIGALAFMRGEPYSPCFFVRAEDGLHAMLPAEDGIYEGAMVGHGAIAIARWVFERLIAAGSNAPWWKYEYLNDGFPKQRADGLHVYAEGSLLLPSEDMYFGKVCEQAGIGHWCDMTLEIPHIILSRVTRQINEAYTAEKPELIGHPTMVQTVVKG